MREANQVDIVAAGRKRHGDGGLGDQFAPMQIDKMRAYEAWFHDRNAVAWLFVRMIFRDVDCHIL